MQGEHIFFISTHHTISLELDVIAAEELDSTPVSELVTVSELVMLSLLEGEMPSQLLEDCASQLQAVTVGALRFSVSQATSANARSDTAESPHSRLVIFFFMILLLFFFSG